MKAVIITGASRGLGAALAEYFLESGYMVGAWARRPGVNWDNWSRNFRGKFFPWTGDLSQTDHISGGLTALMQNMKSGNPLEWILINNAGILDPVKPLSRCTGSEIANHLAVNLAAPLTLSGTFLRLLDPQTPRMVVNISSGAGRSPYPGWTIYCTAKAGLDYFTRCAAEEQKNTPVPARFLSLAPGVVDTDMQAQLREQTPENFPQVARFQAMKDQGQLALPETVAKKIGQIIESNAWENGACVDIRDF